MRCTFPLAAALIAVLIASSTGFAQPPDAGDESKPAPAASGNDASPPAVEKSKLDTFMLRDAKGNLVPILGMTFEEFEQLLKFKRGLAADTPPKYSLDRIMVTGAADDATATLSMSVKVRVREPGWVRVPLRMNEAVLRGTPKYQGEGKFFVTSEADEEGYLCWLKNPSDASSDADQEVVHQVTFDFAIPLAAFGDERSIPLSLPRTTESSLKLKVPLGSIEASLRGGGEGILESRSLSGKESEISLVGAIGEFQLAWRNRREIPPSDAFLESVGEVLIKVEGRDRVTSEAKLRIRSHAGPLETFRVRIPTGMELAPASSVGYSVASLSQTGDSAGSGGRLIEVKLDRPATGAVDIRLTALINPQLKPGDSFEPASWEVLGAARQRGTIDVSVDGDWLLQWSETTAVRRVDIPADSTNGKLAARFEYYRQPCKLGLQVRQRPTRVSVEPTYLVLVDADQVRLEATLNYRIRGTKAEAISIEAGGWVLDRVSPEAHFTSDVGSIRETTPWKLPLGSDAPTEFQIQLQAHLPALASDRLLEFALPRPQADLTTPATVIVLPGDNVELIPDAASLRGLSPESLPTGIKLPLRQQSPLVYRDLGGAEQSLFAAKFRLLERKTAVSSESIVKLDRRRIQVTQQLRYRIAHEPQRVFELAIPAELQQASGLSVAYLDEVLPLEPVTDEAAQPGASSYRFVAPTPLIGRVEFGVKYVLPMPSLDSEGASSVSVPLPVPADRDESEFSTHTLTIGHSEDVKVESIDLPSRSQASSVQADEASQTQFALTHPVERVELSVQPVESRSVATTSIHRQWLQTWLSSGRREERAVWRITATRPFLLLRVPDGVDADGVQLVFDGQPITAVSQDDRTFRIAVPSQKRGTPVVLEAWYSGRLPDSRIGVSVNDLSPPVIDAGASAQHLFWQVSTPTREHVLNEPVGFAPELAWRWKDWYWERQADISQPDLEKWTGASAQPELPPGVNNYVYSAFGAPRSLRIVSASQRVLIVGFSLLSLVITAALLRFARLRNPWVLSALGIACLVAALWSPPLTMFVGQALALGLLAVSISTFALWVFSGYSPVAAPAAPTVRSESVADSQSTRTRTRRPESFSPSTTATAPLGIATEQRP